MGVTGPNPKVFNPEAYTATLILKPDKKDGLDIYKISDVNKFYKYGTLLCPLCRNDIGEWEVKKMKELLDKKHSKKILELFHDYRNLVMNKMEVDIFDELKRINAEIEIAKKDFSNDRYYKHTCFAALRNCLYCYKISFYIELVEFDYTKIEFVFENCCIFDMRYLYDFWKDNLDIKFLLLEKRRKNKIDAEKAQKYFEEDNEFAVDCDS